jgi:hypothetical protein
VKTYPATLYRATPVKQRLRHPVTGFLIGCTDTCFALAVRDATCDSVVITELGVRELSGEWPITASNKSPGLNQDQLVKVAKKLHFRYAKCNGQGWNAVVAAVKQHRRVVAQVWYATIGGGNIGHAVLLEDLQLRPNGWEFVVMDPIKGKRAFISASKIRAAMSDLAVIEGQESDELFWGKTAPTPLIARGAK